MIARRREPFAGIMLDELAYGWDLCAGQGEEAWHDNAVAAIDHVVLRVGDIDRAIAFWRECWAARWKRCRRRSASTSCAPAEALIDLVPVDGKLGRVGGAPPGWQGRNVDHVCLRVEPVRRGRVLRRHLARHGVEVERSGDRYGARATARRSTCGDPRRQHD